MVSITNAVFRTELLYPRWCPLDLQCLENCAIDSNKFHSVELKKSKPHMLILKHYLNNIVIFKSGKMRLMGCQIITANEASVFLLRKLSKLFGPNVMLKPVIHQTTTAKYDFGESINLHKLYETINNSGTENLTRRNRLELESFPALQLRMWDRVHVNVFSSGKVVMSGLKNINSVDIIIADFIVYKQAV